MSRSRLAVRGAVIASVATAAAVLGATSAFAASLGPHVTDGPGDAIYALVLNDKYADLLAVDANLTSSSLTLTDTVAAVRSAPTNDYDTDLTRSGPGNGAQLNSTVTAGSATLKVSDLNGSNVVPVTGTAAYDTGRGTVTATYSLASVNATLASLGKPALASTDQVDISAVAIDRSVGASDTATSNPGG